MGFTRLHLEPGQSERVSIEIPLRRLAWFDQDKDSFVVEGGCHRLLVARHAEDQGVGVEIELEEWAVGR